MQRFVEEFTDGGSESEILVDEALGLEEVHAGGGGEAARAHAVEDAEIDDFGAVSLVFCDLLDWDAVGVAGGFGVDVEVTVEIVDEGLVAGEDGGETEFELAVIGADEEVTLLCDEAVADLAAEFGADGDVLEIWVERTEAAGAGDVLGESGVDFIVSICEFW